MEGTLGQINEKFGVGMKYFRMCSKEELQSIRRRRRIDRTLEFVQQLLVIGVFLLFLSSIQFLSRG